METTIYYIIIIGAIILKGKVLDYLLLCLFLCNIILAFVTLYWFNVFIVFYLFLHFIFRKDWTNSKPVSTFLYTDQLTAI